MWNKLVHITFTVLILSTNTYAQNTSSISLDTSYFKTGENSNNLIEAVNKNSFEAIELLLKRGTDPDVLSSVGNTPLMYASEKGHLAIMHLLISNGASVNVKGFNEETPLLLCIFHNDFDAAKLLLENGADPNTKDGYGVSPLMYAAATNQYQMADLLLFYEADKEMRDPGKNDPLLVAVSFDKLETTDVLLQNGFDVNVQDKDLNTPAIVATQHGNHDILDLLIDYEADVNLSNKQNYTALAYAIVYNDVHAASALLKAGADPGHQIYSGLSLLEFARHKANDSIVNLLKDEEIISSSKPVFSDWRIAWTNTFNRREYLTGFNTSLYDSKYGYYFYSGIDFRPSLLKVHYEIDDILYQFRESRIVWNHGIGKDFQLLSMPENAKLSLYTEVSGQLNFPDYRGSNLDPFMEYKFVPEAGLSYYGQYAGFRIGTSWINYNNILDNPLKINFKLFFRLKQQEVHYDRKEIFWE